jgi:peroxiredoxin
MAKESKRLVPGAKAPVCVLSNIRGDSLNLGALPGRVWLGLFRYAACPFCNSRVHLVCNEQARLEAAGVRVVLVFPSDKARIDKYITRFKPHFDIVCDKERKSYEVFGAESHIAGDLRTAVNIPHVVKTVVQYPNNPLAFDSPFFGLPAEFLLNSGRIENVHYGKTLDDGFSIETVLQWAQGTPGTATL